MHLEECYGGGGVGRTPLNHLQNGQGGQPEEVAAAIAVAALTPRATSNTSASEYTFLIANSFRRF